MSTPKPIARPRKTQQRLPRKPTAGGWQVYLNGKLHMEGPLGKVQAAYDKLRADQSSERTTNRGLWLTRRGRVNMTGA